jgi:GntR family transcriptional regulator, transcriptional repressor for pyruvate dehydrogenase complex
MPQINPIQKRKVSEEIASEIKRLIHERVFTPEERLPSELDLAGQFGVGRTSIREALSMLSSAGLIETRQGEGTFVKNVKIGDYIHPLALSVVTQKEQTLQLLEFRQIIELRAVELAALRRDESDITTIQQTINDLERQIVLGKSGMEADFAFHCAVAAASRNPLILQVMENLTHVMLQSLKYTHRQNEGNSVRQQRVLKEHLQIFKSIQESNPQGAIQALGIHLENVRQKILELD